MSQLNLFELPKKAPMEIALGIGQWRGDRKIQHYCKVKLAPNLIAHLIGIGKETGIMIEKRLNSKRPGPMETYTIEKKPFAEIREQLKNAPLQLAAA